METNPYQPPRELEKPSEEEPKKLKGSDANLCLTASVILIILSGFAAAAPGGRWGTFLLALIFAALALFRADTRIKRVFGGILVILSLTAAVSDFIEGRHLSEKLRLRSERLIKDRADTPN